MGASLFILILTVIFAIALIYIGQIVTGLENELFWLSPDYVKNLGPNIGSAGIDAVVVGGVVSLLFWKLQRSSSHAAYKKLLRHKAERKIKIKLESVVEMFCWGLDLSGFTFDNENINVDIIDSYNFVGKNPSKFDGIIFEGCNLRRVRFGNRKHGCEFNLCKFIECDISHCDFRNSTFNANFGTQPFQMGNNNLNNNNFALSRFNNVIISPVMFKKSIFWGASFIDCKFEDVEWFKDAKSMGLLVRTRSNCWQVPSRWEFYFQSKPSMKKIFYAIGQYKIMTSRAEASPP